MIAKWWLEKQTWHGLVFRATATDRYMLSSGIIHIICTNLYALFDSDDHNNIFAMTQNYIMSTVFLCMKPDELSKRNTPSRQHNRINDKPCTYILFFIQFLSTCECGLLSFCPCQKRMLTCCVLWWEIIVDENYRLLHRFECFCAEFHGKETHPRLFQQKLSINLPLSIPSKFNPIYLTKNVSPCILANS